MILNWASSKYEQHKKSDINDPKWGRLKEQAGNNKMRLITTQDILS